MENKYIKKMKQSGLMMKKRQKTRIIESIKIKIIEFIKNYWIFPLIVIKSLFQASIQIAWGLVSLGLLGWLIFFIKKEYPEITFTSSPEFLLEIGNFILNNTSLLILIFFVVYFYFEYLELKKLQKEVL